MFVERYVRTWVRTYFRFNFSETSRNTNTNLDRIDFLPKVTVIRDCDVMMTTQQKPIYLKLLFLIRKCHFDLNPYYPKILCGS